VQAATADDAKTAGYDALTQEGLLMRTTAEKKVFIIASKQVNNYDLSDKAGVYGRLTPPSRVTETFAMELGRKHQSTIQRLAQMGKEIKRSTSVTITA